MSDNDHDNIFVSIPASDLARPLARDAARGVIAADAAYRELRRHIEAATADGSDAGRFLPSRAWFDAQIERLTPRSRSAASLIQGDK